MNFHVYNLVGLKISHLISATFSISPISLFFCSVHFSLVLTLLLCSL